ncbi:MAG: hypothetical protein M1814_005909 [Vezdaea aestivalis]|nr:MAG: hypothetical protein M1814_005909 [Vezdaea aestivalis]
MSTELSSLRPPLGGTGYSSRHSGTESDDAITQNNLRPSVNSREHSVTTASSIAPVPSQEGTQSHYGFPRVAAPTEPPTLAPHGGVIPAPVTNGQSASNRVFNPLNVPKRQRPLEWYDIAALIINKQIGTGIFVLPAIVLSLVGNKPAALMLWVLGSFYSYASLFVYLEFGTAWPFNGGELVYISKAFPRPSLIPSSAFSWFFICISSSVGNAISFSRYIGFLFAPSPKEGSKGAFAPRGIQNEWLIKLVACSVTIFVCAVHYRLVNIGIVANNLLAFVKVLALFLFFTAGLFGGLIHTSAEYGKTIPGAHDWLAHRETGTRPAFNIALAILLVLYSYQGWENANYVTEEIRGDVESKRWHLKVGGIVAVTVVSACYILINLILFFVLDIDTIINNTNFTIMFNLAFRSFNSKNEIATARGVAAVVMFSALGNLVGVIYTNGRVKREIGLRKLVPFSSYISRSTEFGILRDERGTPSGGLVIHALVTCAIVLSVPYLPGLEGYSFIINLYTYGQVIVNAVLAVGIFFDLPLRYMGQYQTARADTQRGAITDAEWNFQFLKWKWSRLVCSSFVIAAAIYILVITPLPSSNTDGTSRKILSQWIPTVVLTVFAIGIVSGLYVVWTASSMTFRNTTVRPAQGRQGQAGYKAAEIADYVEPKDRVWVLEIPKVKELYSSLSQRSNTWEVFKQRLWDSGEARTARAVREGL